LPEPGLITRQKLGGIVIPDTAKKKPQRGEVLAVGSWRQSEDGKIAPLDVKLGDKVLFGKFLHGTAMVQWH
jgi:chaperonin GroES